jgi:5'-nucleotidase
MLKHSRDTDLVLGGHSHTYLENLEYVNNLDGKPVPVDQNGKHGIFIGRVVMNLK